MERFLLCLAVGLAATVPFVGFVDRGALYKGKVIHRADGLRITVVHPDASANGYWIVHYHHPQLGPIEFSEDAADLLAAERGELPPFHNHPAHHPGPAVAPTPAPSPASPKG